MKKKQIPFNQPYVTGKEIDYIAEAQTSKIMAGGGPFTDQCHHWLEAHTGCGKAFLTHSCTAALEIAALLLDIQPGDEIIMPSYTFVSTANAFVLRGGVPVFVDIREDTLNLDENLIEAAITARTRAIAPVHYGGVACEMDTIMSIARHHNLKVVEDAATSMMASYKGSPLGSIGDLGAYSFHETKNIISGEGGALLVNDDELVSKAEIIWEKGTNRSQFFRGQVDKYSWRDVGSSFMPGDLTAAFLWAQLQEAELITQRRMSIWQHYHELIEPLESKGLLRRPVTPDECQKNAHNYYVLLSSELKLEKVLSEFKRNNIGAVFHYVPLHSSPAGRRYGRVNGSLSVTSDVSESLVRLPFWIGLSEYQQARVVETLETAITLT